MHLSLSFSFRLDCNVLHCRGIHKMEQIWIAKSSKNLDKTSEFRLKGYKVSLFLKGREKISLLQYKRSWKSCNLDELRTRHKWLHSVFSLRQQKYNCVRAKKAFLQPFRFFSDCLLLEEHLCVCDAVKKKAELLAKGVRQAGRQHCKKMESKLLMCQVLKREIVLCSARSFSFRHLSTVPVQHLIFPASHFPEVHQLKDLSWIIVCSSNFCCSNKLF